jgi:hypothetical protein
MTDPPPILDYERAEAPESPPRRQRITFQRLEGGIQIEAEPIGFWRYHARMPPPFWALMLLILPAMYWGSEHEVATGSLHWLLVLCLTNLWWSIRATTAHTIFERRGDRLLIDRPGFVGRRRTWLPWAEVQSLRAVQLHRRYLGVEPFGLLEVKRPKRLTLRLLRGHDLQDLQLVAELLHPGT